MKDLTKLVDTNNTVSVASTSGTPWKERIVTYLLEQPNHRAKITDVLEHTDINHNPENYRARKHCLDSQKTYMKQDLNVIAQYDQDEMVLIGLYDRKKEVVNPFLKAQPTE